jgi:hypothetical protein
MEWDIGAPWYRAPRIVHVVRGGDYGWRSGGGCWPAWFPDSLPPACDTDSASPTGMLDGSGGAFPPPWRNMLFAADWTYGRILAVKLVPNGSTYTASWEVFATGRPMPVTDLAWGPDGAMYVVTGGRGTQSGIYRIATKEPVPNRMRRPIADTTCAAQRSARRALESVAGGTITEPIAAALGADDRFLAFAARTAAERIGALATADAAPSTTPHARAMALLGVVRAADAAQAARAVGMIADDRALRNADPWTRILALRALQVAAARHPETFGARDGAAAGSTNAEAAPSAALAGAFATAFYADPDPRVAEAALGLGCEIGCADAVPAAMARLDAAADRADAMRWATMLRTVDAGWTDELRARYWRWLDAANDAAGGFSLRGFMDHVKQDAEKHVHRPAGSAAPAPASPGVSAAAAPARPAPTGAAIHAWTVDELAAAIPSDAGARDRAHGAQLFRECMCIQCHRFAGEGGANGPDLTGVAARFSRRDLLQSIIEPSAVVSDQWRDTAITLKDGSLVVGRIVGQDAETLDVATNPLGPDRERVKRADIDHTEQVTTSSMPTGLLNARNRAEIMDLVSYLEAGAGPAGATGAATGH